MGHHELVQAREIMHIGLLGVVSTSAAPDTHSYLVRAIATALSPRLSYLPLCTLPVFVIWHKPVIPGVAHRHACCALRSCILLLSQTRSELNQVNLRCLLSQKSRQTGFRVFTLEASLSRAQELITEDDVDALEHLVDVACVDKEDMTGECLFCGGGMTAVGLIE
jgi:hypothetical protein